MSHDYFLNSRGQKLAYRYSPASTTNPEQLTIVFLGGFNSNMQGIKATSIEQYCLENNLSCLCFDYSAHGLSDGDMKDACLSDWIQDTSELIENLVQGPALLIGSSLGGWISLIVAQRIKQVVAIVGLAAAADFTSRIILPSLNEASLNELESAGQITIDSDYDDSQYLITSKLIEDAKQHLLLEKPILIEIPVVLIHGQQDPDIPWQTSLEIAERLSGEQVTCHLLKSSDHRLSEPSDIQFITHQLNRLVSEL